MSPPRITVRPPQEQLHNHAAVLRVPFGNLPTGHCAVKRPKDCPVRSLMNMSHPSIMKRGYAAFELSTFRQTVERVPICLIGIYLRAHLVSAQCTVEVCNYLLLEQLLCRLLWHRRRKRFTQTTHPLNL